MRYLRWIWCWLRHERISGVCLRCAGLIPISGGQDDLFNFASDMGGAAEAMQPPDSGGYGAPPATGAGGGMGVEYAPGTTAETPAGGGFWNFAKNFGKDVGYQQRLSIPSGGDIGSAKMSAQKFNPSAADLLKKKRG